MQRQLTFFTLLSFNPFPSTATFPNEMFSLGICCAGCAAAAAAVDNADGEAGVLSARCLPPDDPSSFAFSVCESDE
jgi:hypothetical protein